eukprot:scaffold64983_cov31-Tisochrysis_lutea.AAC.3
MAAVKVSGDWDDSGCRGPAAVRPSCCSNVTNSFFVTRFGLGRWTGRERQVYESGLRADSDRTWGGVGEVHAVCYSSAAKPEAR